MPERPSLFEVCSPRVLNAGLVALEQITPAAMYRSLAFELGEGRALELTAAAVVANNASLKLAREASSVFARRHTLARYRLEKCGEAIKNVGWSALRTVYTGAGEWGTALTGTAYLIPPDFHD
jgi:hypothetical protein